ncbi:MAG: protein-disulfide reductase DsbD domain-containing protein, partial [Planctomycetota bacterium]
MGIEAVCRVLFGLVLSAFGHAAAQPGGWGETHSSVKLVSEHDALVPGETAMLGLLFEMEKGWHIYQPSQNDTGLEPMPEWSADAGLRVGAIVWPAGHRFTQPGEILDHGYEGTVLLMVPVKVPESAAVGSELTVRANVEWLACDAAQCVPGQAEVSVTLPVRASADASEHAGAFADVRGEMSEELRGEVGQPVSVSWDGSVMVVRSAREGVLSFVPDAGCARVRGLFASGASTTGELRLDFGDAEGEV